MGGLLGFLWIHFLFSRMTQVLRPSGVGRLLVGSQQDLCNPSGASSKTGSELQPASLSYLCPAGAGMHKTLG